jgi:hypothetical protein
MLAGPDPSTPNFAGPTINCLMSCKSSNDAPA